MKQKKNCLYICIERDNCKKQKISGIILFKTYLSFFPLNVFLWTFSSLLGNAYCVMLTLENAWCVVDGSLTEYRNFLSLSLFLPFPPLTAYLWTFLSLFRLVNPSLWYINLYIIYEYDNSMLHILKRLEHKDKVIYGDYKRSIMYHSLYCWGKQ